MNTLEAILSRRSIRKYTSEKVSDEQIKNLLKAAMFAPSARNEQPWHFIVINQKPLLEALSRVHPYGKMLKEAPLAILVCADEMLEPATGYWVLDCAAATQNILLAAHSMGLGTVWLGIYPREDRIKGIRELTKLPEHIHPVSLIAIGHPSEIPMQPQRFKIDRIRYNFWE
ncbi:MAG: nitroreductase family protein [Bacteroidota bacterium]